MKQRFRRVLLHLLTGLLFIAQGAAAAEKSGDTDELRELYSETMDSLTEGHTRDFRRNLRRLRDYPLYPYLEFSLLNRKISRASEDGIRKFLDKYPDTPLSSRLRKRWLEYLQKQDRWRDFLLFYSDEVADTPLTCYYQLARYRDGAREEALQAAEKLWVVGRSQPDACDPLFALLADDERITESLAWQRYSLAVLNHQYRLARYIERFFRSEEYRQLARNYVSVDRNYRLVGKYDLFSEQSPEIRAVIEHGLIHLARSDAPTALKHWRRYRQSHNFDVATRSRILGHLVRGLYNQGHRQTADRYLEKQLDLADLRLLEWRLQAAIRDGDWQMVCSWLEKLPDEAQQEPRWQYWQARSRVLSGQAGPRESEPVYRQLSEYRHYYGFLASQWLGSDKFAMEYKPAPVTQEAVDAMAATPAFQRIRELLYHDEQLDARREWLYVSRHFSETEWLVSGRLAQQWQWHNPAITAMIKASFWDDIEIRFPRPFLGLFEQEAHDHQIPVNLLFALSRQESAFHPLAISPAGARGLMQLMPSTAKITARKHGIPYRNRYDLSVPSTNIKIGSQYYKDMMERFDNNRVLAIAAYNAGPHRVEQWLEKTAGKLPVDAWIEAIPFRETRNYVQNVLAFSVIYAHHLGNGMQMLDEKELEKLL